MTICPKCGGRRYAGRGGIHDRGDCTTAWYRALRGLHPMPCGRPKRTNTMDPPDLTPEQIERIMRRRAIEQRYERAVASGPTGE